MKPSRKTLNIIVAVTVVIAATLGLVAYLAKDSSGMVRLKSYNSGRGQEVMCLALIPECGDCPGEVRGDDCYVTREEAAKWQ